MTPSIRSAALGSVLTLWLAAAAMAQWNPPAGQWGKAAPTDLRVMTWNVEDGICSSNPKIEGANDWTALARILAVLQPDILLIQEAGDNAGNGTGGGVDSTQAIETVIGLLVNGGTDPFRGGPVTAYVRKYLPPGSDYDLPHIAVSTLTDGFNRNAIASRYPFADLNGDGLTTVGDFQVQPAAYAPGGGGGVRGFLIAEIDLPNQSYWGNVVVGCSHLRCCGAASDLAERLASAQNIAYFLDGFFNGAGSPTPNPGGFILSPPTPPMVLQNRTPVIWGGDWNEDEQSNARKGPAEWMTQAQLLGGTDGTDRDRSDCTYDNARDVFNNSRGTYASGTTKFDYIAWQDSIATLRRAFLFSTSTMVSAGAATPAPLAGYAGSISSMTATASDHKPVVLDFILPPPCPGDWDGNGRVDPADVASFVNRWAFDLSTGGLASDINGDNAITPSDVALFVTLWFSSLTACG